MTQLRGEDGASYRYAAFISYRHVEPDRKWAKWLHRSLEPYRVPKALRQAHGLSLHLGRVFRDEEELSASSDLSHEIQAALQQSQFLIVVCSPRTPSSAWVNQEVAQFREMGRGGSILALLVEGDPSAAFPTALREIRHRVTGEEGRFREEIEEVEPLAADVRLTGRGHGGHVRRTAKLRLLSCLLGCRFDELRRREHERHMRRISVVGGALLAVIGVLVGLSLYAFQQRDLAEQRLVEVQEARDHESLARTDAEGLAKFMLNDLHDKLKPLGRTDLLSEVARRAKQYYERLPARHVTPETELRRTEGLRLVADVLLALGKSEASLEAYRESLRICQSLLAAHPGSVLAMHSVAVIHLKVGAVMQARGKTEEALDSTFALFTAI